MTIETIAVEMIKIDRAGASAMSSAMEQLKQLVETWASVKRKLLPLGCGLEVTNLGSTLKVCVWVGGRDCPVYSSIKTFNLERFQTALAQVGFEAAAMNKYIAQSFKREFLLP